MTHRRPGPTPGTSRAPDGTARQQTFIKVAPAAAEVIRELAEQEVHGNSSEMVRRLLLEALAARRSA